MFNCIKCDNKIFKNLINGEWISSKDGNFIEITSPLDNSIVGKVPAMTKEEVDLVFKTSKEAQIKWKKVPVNERAEILYKAANILLDQSDELTEIMIREIGKDKKSSKSEITRTADFIRFTADTAKNMSGESIPGDSFPGFNRNKISVVTREPLGVVLAISPFNYPVNLSASKIAPAIVAGNSVVLKPATQGSLCGLYLARVFEEAGVPKGVLNTITGKGSEIGDYIVTHPNVNFINFTGSTEVGIRISKITSMVPLLMELGGKDAAIVLEDANLELTANNIVAGGYSYSGQRCTAVKRILVVDKVADKLVEKVKEKMNALKVGNPLEKDVDNVTTEMRLAWEEPFGPVLPIIRVKDKDEAIEIANKSEYGLQGAVFTENINDAFYIADKLDVGTVQVNNKTERGPDHFPFLGVKASGIGTQGIRYSIEAMSRPKATVINLNRG